MFGHNQKPDPSRSPSLDKTGREMLSLQTNLLQILLIGPNPSDFIIILNGAYQATKGIDNIQIIVEAVENGLPTIQAAITTQSDDASHPLASKPLLPGVIEITGRGTRLIIVGMPNGDIGVGFGLLPNGSTNEAAGIKRFAFTLTMEFVSAEVVWDDDKKEELLAE